MTRTIDPRDLSRGDRRKLQRQPSFDQLAERLVAREFGLGLDDSDVEWYDLASDTGTKYEVKSTSREIRSGPGRFRLFEGQTRSLLASDARGTAWYVFVLFDGEAGVLRMQRRRPSTVASTVRDRGGWNRSGHDSQGRQHKLPWSEVFDL
jgi:hypothetical protein